MKILVIEDDQNIAELFEFNLKKELPDLIILDLMLPDLGGLDVCRQVKSDPKTRDLI